jgi:enterobactin synthetase component D
MLLSPFVTQISMNLPCDKSMSDALIAAGLFLPENLKSAHPKRQEKYLAGRLCAHLAFKKAGEIPPQDIPMGEDGSPTWPTGWTGSITHTEGYVAAAIAKKSEVAGIGIDSEPLMTPKTYSNVSARILIGKELTELKPAGWSEEEWATFVFSAKESIYKCLRPLCGNFFGFEDAEMNEVNEEQKQFNFHLTRDIGGPFKSGWNGQGHFEKINDWIHTAVVHLNH